MLRVMNDEHPACLPIAKLLAQCDVRHERRSGPGGQHRNKVSTAIVLVHRPTGVRAEANERRSQADNRRVALRRLRVRLALEIRSPQPRDVPSELWKSRVAAGRIAVNSAHEDFPALLAVALDAVAAAKYDFLPAAERLHITTSQLQRFLKLEPAAWSLLNAARRERGLRTLH
jgi:hypothetical protein